VDQAEPEQLAISIERMRLRYVVITSVDRDDLRDGGAGHFADCLRAVRQRCPDIKLEVLVPDFRGREQIALAAFVGAAVPDVFNHNLETVPRLYREARPGADYAGSLALLSAVQDAVPVGRDQVRHHARPWGDRGRGHRRDARPARAHAATC
jgi:lipoic acid synthetase